MPLVCVPLRQANPMRFGRKQNKTQYILRCCCCNSCSLSPRTWTITHVPHPDAQGPGLPFPVLSILSPPFGPKFPGPGSGSQPSLPCSVAIPASISPLGYEISFPFFHPLPRVEDRMVPVRRCCVLTTRLGLFFLTFLGCPCLSSALVLYYML